MELKLTRSITDLGCTIGILSHQTKTICHTLEDEVREIQGQPVASWKIPKETAIPRGRYKVIIDYSNRFQKYLPHILDVPGFEGVRIHAGNTSADTEGCILVGKFSPNHPDMITDSRNTFAAVFNLIKDALESHESVYLTIS